MTYNRIVHHGDSPSAGYAKIPNTLIRDGSITADAYRVLSLLLSHEPGQYGESKRSIAKLYHWTWRRANGAVEELIARRFLVVQSHQNPEGHRTHETYHVNAQKFSAAAVGDLCPESPYAAAAHPLVGRGGYVAATQGAMPQQHTTHMPQQQHIEDQTEDQIEDQSEQIDSKKKDDAKDEQVSKLDDLTKEFLAAYPKAGNYDVVREALRLELNSKGIKHFPALIASTKAYAEQVSGKESKYIKNPENFLRDGWYQTNVQIPQSLDQVVQKYYDSADIEGYCKRFNFTTFTLDPCPEGVEREQWMHKQWKSYIAETALEAMQVTVRTDTAGDMPIVNKGNDSHESSRIISGRGN